MTVERNAWCFCLSSPTSPRICVCVYVCGPGGARAFSLSPRESSFSRAPLLSTTCSQPYNCLRASVISSLDRFSKSSSVSVVATQSQPCISPLSLILNNSVLKFPTPSEIPHVLDHFLGTIKTWNGDNFYYNFRKAVARKVPICQSHLFRFLLSHSVQNLLSDSTVSPCRFLFRLM